jgi:DNA repair protein RadB
MKELKISAGSYDLNKWLFGGYDSDVITTIYGPAGSGKTNFCLLVAVSQAKKENKIVYIDSEGGFSTERVKQIAGEDYERVLKNIMLLKPVNFSEQKKDFEVLLREIGSKSKIGLIIIDSLTIHYRIELGEAIQNKEEHRIKEINKELAKQLSILVELSRKKNIPIVITNQVYYDFSDDFERKEERKANMVGGDLLKYWSKCHIELKNSQGKRTAILRKHRSLPEKEMNFIIIDSGIRKKNFFI